MKPGADPVDASSSFSLLQRRTVWWPTSLGWVVIGIALLTPIFCSFLAGEAFLSHTERSPKADVLVVEGWIGREGVRAAAAEFEAQGYKFVATSGGPDLDRWETKHSTYAEMAGVELAKLGVPSDKILIAPCQDTKSGRTFAAAAAVARAFATVHLQPKRLNVFTYGPHARRSRLVYAKVFGGATDVGVITWTPAEHGSAPWWQSSQRSKALLSEIVGYLLELLLNSGRLSNDTAAS